MQAGLINVLGGKVEGSAVFKAFGPVGKAIANATSNIAQGGLSAASECLSGNCSKTESTIASNAYVGPLSPITSKALQTFGVPKFVADLGGEIIKTATQRQVIRTIQRPSGGGGRNHDVE